MKNILGDRINRVRIYKGKENLAMCLLRPKPKDTVSQVTISLAPVAAVFCELHMI